MLLSSPSSRGRWKWSSKKPPRQPHNHDLRRLIRIWNNMPKPIVALVGRPNVGKSTLFNRLAGERLAIVDDIPGTTRDRIIAEADWNGRPYDIVDTGGIDPTHGGKTPLSVDSADFIQEIRQQALMAVNDADAVLFIADGSAGVTPPDREVAEILRRYQKTVNGQAWPPIFVVVNKCENA